MMKKNRLSKVLASCGVASRRACEEIIFSGRVTVNGQKITIPQTPVDLSQDEVCVDQTRVRAAQQKVYYVFHKPPGVLCTNERPGKQPIVLDFFTDRSERLFTVGRLDKDTTGLLLVTNDGHFAQQVIHPSANIPKEYLVKTDQEITEVHLQILSRGARVDHQWVKPVFVKKVRKGTFKICVKEGKKHEVRILAERAGLKVLDLSRIRIGCLFLGSLPLGAYRPLTLKDRQSLLCK